MNLRDFFIALSENRVLNAKNIACTVDNLGEFVTNEAEVQAAKANILAVIETIHAENLHAHVSLKPTQLGLSFDPELCYNSLYDIVKTAHDYGIFINFDTETYEIGRASCRERV